MPTKNSLKAVLCQLHQGVVDTTPVRAVRKKSVCTAYAGGDVRPVLLTLLDIVPRFDTGGNRAEV